MDQRDIYTSSISDIVHVHPLLLDAVLFLNWLFKPIGCWADHCIVMGAGGDQTSNWPLDIYTYLESGPNVVVTTCSWSPWPHPAPATSTHTQATRHAAPGTQTSTTVEADWLNKAHLNYCCKRLIGKVVQTLRRAFSWLKAATTAFTFKTLC